MHLLTYTQKKFGTHIITQEFRVYFNSQVKKTVHCTKHVMTRARKKNTDFKPYGRCTFKKPKVNITQG